MIEVKEINGQARDTKIPETTAPILEGLIPLKEYEIQGKVYKQRKPCIDQELRIEKKEFQRRLERHQEKYRSKLTNEYSSDSELRKIYKYVSAKDIETYLTTFEKITELELKLAEVKESKDDYEIEKLGKEIDVLRKSQIKMEKFRYKYPGLHTKLMSHLGNLYADNYSLLEQFVMDRNNLRILFDIMLEGKDEINYKPDSEAENEKLDKIGLQILNDFFLSHGKLNQLAN